MASIYNIAVMITVFAIKIFRGCLASSYWWELPNIVKHCLQFCSHDCPVRCWTRHLTRSRRAGTSRWSATRTSTPSSSATPTRAASPATCSAPCPPSEHSSLHCSLRYAIPWHKVFIRNISAKVSLIYCHLKNFFFASYRKYKGSFNNDVIGFG